MKPVKQFRALLVNELIPGRMGNMEHVAGMMGVVVVYWLYLAGLPWVLLFGAGNANQRFDTLVESNLLPVMSVPYFLLLTGWLSYNIVPALREILPPGGAIPGVQPPGNLEFFFSKAADRRTLFRAKVTAHLAILGAPLVVNVILALFIKRETLLPGCLWLAWTALAAILLLEGYCGFIAKKVTAKNAWTGLYAAIPLVLLVAGAIYFEKWSYELFQQHAVPMFLGLVLFGIAVHRACENRFCQYEII